MKKYAAVTICSINYIAKALVLFDSYIKYHPEHDFYLVIVDRKSSKIDINRPDIKIIWVEDLGIPNFLQYAFSYDVIEFNTNVKPTVLISLLNIYDNVIYLDPDIKVYAPLDPVFKGLENASFVVTPHCNTPILDDKKPGDIELLKFGGFNLGFIGVSKCEEGFEFLRWWSERCLEYGFYEPQLGLAVDQKWVSIAPCFFPNMKILHDDGLNVAFWNLHERKLDLIDGFWVVNGRCLLRFVHFSSFNEDSPGVIANKQDRFLPDSRLDFNDLSYPYAQDLILNFSKKFSENIYGFNYFEDGTYITPSLRRFYGQLRLEHFKTVQNPFSSDGVVMQFAKKNGLLNKDNSLPMRHTFKGLETYRLQVKIINKLLYITLRVMGPERYFNLMRYLSHISSLRNQTQIFGNIK